MSSKFCELTYDELTETNGGTCVAIDFREYPVGGWRYKGGCVVFP